MFRISGFHFLIISVLLLWSVYWLWPAWREQKQTARTLQKINQEIIQRQKVKEDLQASIHRLKTDPRAVERVARDKFGLCRPGEKIYDFGAPSQP